MTLHSARIGRPQPPGDPRMEPRDPAIYSSGSHQKPGRARPCLDSYPPGRQIRPCSQSRDGHGRFSTAGRGAHTDPEHGHAWIRAPHVHARREWGLPYRWPINTGGQSVPVANQSFRGVGTVPASLASFRMRDDGKPKFARKCGDSSRCPEWHTLGGRAWACALTPRFGAVRIAPALLAVPEVWAVC